MYKPRAVPVLTGRNAERFYEWQEEAESKTPSFDLKATKESFKKIMARSKNHWA